MKKKGFAPVIGLIFAVVVLAVIFVPGLGTSVMGALTGEHQYCNDARYDSSCVCNLEDRKISLDWMGVPIYHCEIIQNLLLDPDSSTFEQDAISYVKIYYTQNCGNVCGELTCGNEARCVQGSSPDNSGYCIDVISPWAETGDRLASISCIHETTGTSSIITWQLRFLVESKDTLPYSLEVFKGTNYCYNENTQQKCDAPISYVPNPV